MLAFHTFSHRALALALSLTALVGLATTTARAQTPGDETVALTLIRQPVWHDADDPLALRLRVANQGLATLDGFRLQVRVYPRARSRSELHSNFEISPLSVELDSLSVDELDTSVPAGSSTVVTIDDPVSDLSALVGEEPGVYPLTITVTASDGFTALDSITTQLLYFPDEVEVPLNLVLMWPLVDLPSRRAGEVFEPEPETGATALETATAEDGWLTGIIDALEAPQATSLRFGLSPEGRLVEELGDMRDGFRRAEDDGVRTISATDPSSEAAASTFTRMNALLDNARVQPVISPYAYPDLTSIDDLERLSAQLTATESVFEELVGITPERAWLWPPAGRLDAITLERLRSTEAAASTFFSQDSLAPVIAGTPGCREDFVGITFTCPVKVTTTSDRTSHGYVLDAELQQRFGALVSAPRDIGELQKLFAEITMIWAELPGISLRVIPLAVPPLWHPPPAIATRFVRTMAKAPWIRSRTPRGGLHLDVGAVPRDLVTDAPRLRSQPDPSFFESIQDAADLVENFARIRPPVTLVQRLRRDVLVAQSLLWWADAGNSLEAGASFATDAQREAAAELGKISIGGKRDITLTSRTGPVPLSLQNGTDYDVTLEVRLESDRDLEINDRVLSQTFSPGATALPIQASARASGIYPVRVRVQTADGFQVYETVIRIRSTEFNEIALAITIGALVFLVMFSMIRGVRRRRHPVEAAEPE